MITTNIELEVDGKFTEIVITADKKVQNNHQAMNIARVFYPNAYSIRVEKIYQIS